MKIFIDYLNMNLFCKKNNFLVNSLHVGCIFNVYAVYAGCVYQHYIIFYKISFFNIESQLLLVKPVYYEFVFFIVE